MLPLRVLLGLAGASHHDLIDSALAVLDPDHGIYSPAAAGIYPTPPVTKAQLQAKLDAR